MLTALSFILISIIVIPLVLIILILAFGLSFIARIIRPRYPERMPKGTIEILPAEIDEESSDAGVGKKGNVKDRKVGKDKFREL